MYKFKISFWEALKRINEDFQLELSTRKPKSLPEHKQYYKFKDIKIQVVLKEWEDFELTYWKEYGITKKILSTFNVLPISRVYVNKELTHRSTSTNPIFAYHFPKTDKVKIYRPLHKDRSKKWYGSVTKDDINGYDQLPFEGNLLFITSSLKDVMCLRSLGYAAIAPQGESQLLDLSIVESLKEMFREVILFYDNDEAGISSAKKHSEIYKIKYIHTPIGQPKDISDYYKTFGRSKTKKLVNEILQRAHNRIKTGTSDAALGSCEETP